MQLFCQNIAYTLMKTMVMELKFTCVHTDSESELCLVVVDGASITILWESDIKYMCGRQLR